jgi:hypothetical protein
MLLRGSWAEVEPKIARWNLFIGLELSEPDKDSRGAGTSFKDLDDAISTAEQILTSAKTLRALDIAFCAPTYTARLLECAARHRFTTLRRLYIVVVEADGLGGHGILSRFGALESLQLRQFSMGVTDEESSQMVVSECDLPRLRTFTFGLHLYNETTNLRLSHCTFDYLEHAVVRLGGVPIITTSQAAELCVFLRRHAHIRHLELGLNPTGCENLHEIVLAGIKSPRFTLHSWFPPEWVDVSSPQVDILVLELWVEDRVFRQREYSRERTRLDTPYGLLTRISARAAAGLAVPRQIVVQYQHHPREHLSWRA